MFATQIPHPRLGGIFFTVLTLTLAAGTLEAQDRPRWILRGGAQFWTGIDDQVTIDRTGGEQTTHGVADAAGFGLALEFMAGRRLGLEVGGFLGDLESDFRLDGAATALNDSGEFGMYVLYFGVNYHVSPGRRADVYAGAFLAQANYDDFVFLAAAGRDTKLRFDDDFGAGVKLGVDVPFTAGGSWIFAADVRLLTALLESEAAGEDLDLNPLVVSIGVGFRF